MFPHLCGRSSFAAQGASQGAILFHKENGPLLNPPRERFLIGSLGLE